MSDPQTEHVIKICVIGTRGFPDIQGGIESHCENLYPELVKNSCEIIVFTRKPYITKDRKSYRGINLITLSCPKSKHFEAIIHTLKGLFFARKLKADIVHIHAIGPALVTPIARLMGMKVVITHHGSDYMRAKWGLAARTVLRIGEFLGVKFAHKVIAITNQIAEDIKKYSNNVIVIPNGVNIPETVNAEDFIKGLGLQKNKYILAVARFVPEKGLHFLIDAFNMIDLDGFKLVIAGDADHEDSYSRVLKKSAANNKNIIMPGFVSQELLKELYSHAALFVLPSFHEGLPIVLLEAMSYGLSCLASDIPANRYIDLREERFFEAGNVKVLSKKLEQFKNKNFSEEEKREQINKVAEKYKWGKIAEETFEVYKRCIL